MEPFYISQINTWFILSTQVSMLLLLFSSASKLHKEAETAMFNYGCVFPLLYVWLQLHVFCTIIMGMLNFCNSLKVVWGTPLSLIMMQCSRRIRRYMIRRVPLSLSFHSLIREAELLHSRPIRVKISLRKLMRHPVREVQLFSHFVFIC